MIIFIPLLIFFGLIVPWLIARLLCDVFQISTRRLRLIVLIAVVFLNWEWWQAPRAVPPQASAPSSVGLASGR
jgi:hypothetical protein